MEKKGLDLGGIVKKEELWIVSEVGLTGVDIVRSVV
jgi:hypothetical protein